MRGALFLALVLLLASAVGAQEAIMTPAPPIAPEVMARDAEGRATVRATRISSPLKVDGRLDEEVFRTITPITGFIQMEPDRGKPATDLTEMWILFDDTNVYLVARCWEPSGRVIADDMRRDGSNVLFGDYVGFMLDTFHDRRNGYVFNVGAVGGLRDGLITDEKQYNADWNGVVRAVTGRFDGGWVVEVAVPFKTLRYQPGQTQVWGFNAHRGQTLKNEHGYFMPMTGAPPTGALLKISLAGNLVGIEAPPGSKNLEIKPYATSSATEVQPSGVREGNAEAGVDVKYGITQNLTADFTFNTDFAQVEADEQQVNLTRFSLFFPEKREFFLENAGIFAFAGTTGGSSTMPVLFYTRRIGLNEGRPIPLDAGGRLTGRVGRFSVGALSIRSGTETVSRTPATTFSVVRVKRDIFRRSSIGAIATNRSATRIGTGANQAYGVDASMGLLTSLDVTAFWAATRTDGVHGDNRSYQAAIDYNADRYGFRADRLAIGNHFNPEIGFVRRRNMRRDFGSARFSPRTPRRRFVRRLSWTGSLERIEATQGRLENRLARGAFDAELNSGDGFGLAYDDSYEFVPTPFRLLGRATIASGDYGARNVRATYSFGSQRMLAGTVSVEHGSFYGGDRTTLTVSQGRLALSNQLSISPSLAINTVTLPQGAFTSPLVTTRFVYTINPGMFTSALVQYNASANTVSANVRLRWEYRPGSEIFLVYNEERDPRTVGFPGLQNRAFIVKVNRLLRF